MSGLKDCPVKLPEEWAKDNGYSYERHQFSPQKFEDYFIDDCGVPQWSFDAARFFGTERDEAVVVTATDAKVCTAGFALANGGQDEAFYVFSQDWDLHMENPYWLPFFSNWGPFRGYDDASNVLRVEFAGSAHYELQSPAFMLGSRGNWGHWLTDFLPRLMFWKDLPNRSEIKLLTGPLSPMHKKTLAVCGVSEEDCLELPIADKSLSIISCRELIVPPTPPTRICYDYMRSVFAQRALETTDTPKRIYLTRRHHAPFHRVANDAAVAAHLEARGFVTLEIEAIPLAEQLDILAQAEVVATPFGAGIANACVMSPNAVIIALLPLNFVLNVDAEYKRHAAYPYWFGIGLKFLPVFGLPEVDTNDGNFDLPILIDLDALDAAIDRAETHL